MLLIAKRKRSWCSKLKPYPTMSGARLLKSLKKFTGALVLKAYARKLKHRSPLILAAWWGGMVNSSPTCRLKSWLHGSVHIQVLPLTGK